MHFLTSRLSPYMILVMEQVSELELLIIDCLSVDNGCVASIRYHEAEGLHDIPDVELKNAIYGLYKRGLIHDRGISEPIPRESIMAEDTSNQYHTGNYYFGLTPAGVEFWEEARRKNGDPVDWSRMWSAYTSPEQHEGYIDGTFREVCLNVLKSWNDNGLDFLKDWQVDMDSLMESEIEGFYATYYKYISGGHRIFFKLKRR